MKRRWSGKLKRIEDTQNIHKRDRERGAEQDVSAAGGGEVVLIHLMYHRALI